MAFRLQPSVAVVGVRQSVGDAGAGEPAGAGCLPGGGLGGQAKAGAHISRPSRTGPGLFYSTLSFIDKNVSVKADPHCYFLCRTAVKKIY
jgi:hypothetical protein